MTATQFNKQIKFFDFPKTHLDNIDERCGEVYITFNGTLVFHCSLCARNYGSIENFLDHLSLHYKDIQEEEELKDAGKTDNYNDAQTGRSDIGILFEDFTTDKIYQEHKLVNGNDIKDDDAIDDGVDGDVKVDVNEYEFDEYKQIIESKESPSLDWINFEPDAEKIKDEIEIGVETLCAQNFKETSTTSKQKGQLYEKNMLIGNSSYLNAFICKACGRRCKTKLSLQRHSTTHTDERKYKCKICDFAFKERSHCVSHVRRIHLGTNKIECGYCPKTFFTQNEVTSHRRTHTGERPYACSVCNKTYTTHNRLNMHNKRHTSEPTFKCSYCEKAFYEKLSYEDHILVHTKEKQFVCEICAATFPRSNSWRRHSAKCTKNRQSNESLIDSNVDVNIFIN